MNYELKGELILNDFATIEMDGKTKFIIRIPNKKYVFKVSFIYKFKNYFYIFYWLFISIKLYLVIYYNNL